MAESNSTGRRGDIEGGPAVWEWAVLAAILGLATAARIAGLNSSLWYDEVYTLTRYVRLPTAELVQTFTSLNNHMFYSLQAQAAIGLFGEHAWTLRLPAVLFGLAGLVAVWAMGRGAVGRWPALFATFLLAISYHHVWFSQNARGYTGLLFWTTLATILFVRGLSRPGLRDWTLYGLCLAAGMYTHLSAGFFFAAHAVVFAGGWLLGWFRPGLLVAHPGFRDMRPFYGFALGGLVTLLLHIPLIAQVFSAVGKVSKSAGRTAMAEWENPLRALQEMVASLADLGPLVPLALAGGLLLLALGVWSMMRRAPLLTLIYVVQIPLMLAMLAALSFRIWPRYFLVDIGFLYLAAAAGAFVLADLVAGLLGRAWASPVARHGPILAGVLVMSAASLILLIRNYAHPKQDLAGAVAYVQAHRGAGDVATSVGLASEPIESYFAPDWPVVESGAELARLADTGRTVWLVTAFRTHTTKTHPDAAAVIERRFREVALLPGTLGDGNVRVYRSLAPGRAP